MDVLPGHWCEAMLRSAIRDGRALERKEGEIGWDKRCACVAITATAVAELIRAATRDTLLRLRLAEHRGTLLRRRSAASGRGTGWKGLIACLFLVLLDVHVTGVLGAHK